MAFCRVSIVSSVVLERLLSNFDSKCCLTSGFLVLSLLLFKVFVLLPFASLIICMTSSPAIVVGSPSRISATALWYKVR